MYAYAIVWTIEACALNKSTVNSFDFVSVGFSWSLLKRMI